jgi:hypothetical protein
MKANFIGLFFLEIYNNIKVFESCNRRRDKIKYRVKSCASETILRLNYNQTNKMYIFALIATFL